MVNFIPSPFYVHVVTLHYISLNISITSEMVDCSTLNLDVATKQNTLQYLDAAFS